MTHGRNGTYKAFLAAKRIETRFPGIEPQEPHEILFPFQRDIVKWALRRGRACVWADCGLGKTFIQLEWARQIPDNVLILAPLAVANQTIAEGVKLGCVVRYCRDQSEVKKGITIANYEMLEHFDPAKFKGIVLDESSIIKHFEGKFRNAIIAGFAETPYRLACTATPAPNDHMELGNHAEFVGAMTRTEMLSMFFVHDGGDTSKWRLKGHAEKEFWKWVCSWAVMIRKPSDLGYEDNGFILPPLTIEQISVEAENAGAFLFPLEAQTLQERIAARRESVTDRVKKCSELVFANFRSNIVKLATCQSRHISSDITGRIEPSDSTPQFDTSDLIGVSAKNTCAATTKRSPRNSSARKSSGKPSMPVADRDTSAIQSLRQDAESNPDNAIPSKKEIAVSAQSLESEAPNTTLCSRSKKEDAQFATKSRGTSEGIALPWITAINPVELEGCYARIATLDLASFVTTFDSLKEPLDTFEPWLIFCNLNSEQEELEEAFGDLCISIIGTQSPETKAQLLTDWIVGKRPICISKPSIIGFGINAQICRNVAFVGLSDSWEQYYQAVRRCWRFGQTKEVRVHIITSTAEGAVVANIKRKEADAARMALEMVKHMHSMNEANIKGTGKTEDAYVEDVARGENYELHLGDCVEVAQKIPSNSVGFSIFSPPFASLYTYSASERDLGNVKNDAEFHKHFAFVITELYRVLIPGRLVSFHCMDMPSMKSRDGMIGLKDFPAILIQAFQAAGFIYHSRVVIWKDPLIEATRTKALGLMHKQILKDSSMCRQGLPDYLITMRKPGDNGEPIQHPDGFTSFIGLDEPKAPRSKPRIEAGDSREDRSLSTTSDDPVYSHQVWRRYASPVWMDIDQTRTLQRESAREEKDERHICPLQLDVIERALELWSNPGDTVLSPFAGIGSEGFVAVSRKRRFIGIELKTSYWKQAAANLALAEAERDHDLFTTAPEARQTAIPA